MIKRTSEHTNQPHEAPLASVTSPEINEADGVHVGEEPVSGMRLRAICRGHEGSIGRIAWSPCGRFIASPSQDKTVRIWDATNGYLIQKLKGHNWYVYSVAWLNNEFVVSGASDHSGQFEDTLRLWNVKTGVCLREIPHHRNSVYSLVTSPNNDYLASGSFDGTVCLWKIVDSPNLIEYVREFKLRKSVYAVAWSPDGHQIAFGGQNGSVSVRHISEQKESRELKGPADYIYGLSWSPDSKHLVSVTVNQRAVVWDLDSSQVIRYLEGHSSQITSAAYSRNGRVLVTKSNDGSILLWNTNKWTPLGAVAESSSTDWRTGIACHLKDSAFATLGGEDELIRIWDFDEGRLLGVKPSEKITQSTSAKIVLVGETDVGKSCLAMRLAEGRYPEDYEHGTTHGMRFWLMEAEVLYPSSKPPKGQRRAVVLWDFGGQDEYQLVHQMFLHDTTLALVLIDPTRGKKALDEARDWNKRLEKHLGKEAVKLLVGAKVDNSHKSKHIDHSGIDLLCQECGFAAFVDLSAKTGRYTKKLRKVIADALDWDAMAKTSRPELFQHIRDDIERRRRDNEIVLTLEEFKEAIKQSAAEMYEEAAVDAVSDQLATQGVIVRTQLTGGDQALVLQLPVIERYAGSLIIAARNNPRGVPVLEERLLGSAKGIPLPGMPNKGRLKRDDERMVLECIVELMIQHGICFRHGGLLVFPTLFPGGNADNKSLPHSISLYYDFTGAIDNIYASLVSKLMVSQEFGEGRLDAGRVEFERLGEGVCGVRQIKRTGGLAHIDLFFSNETQLDRRDLFTHFVEQHLKHHGVEIREYQIIKCSCGEEISERIIRARIAAEEKDVICPICEQKTLISDGVAIIHERDPESERKIIALRQRIEKETGKVAARVKAAVANETVSRQEDETIRLLHLSDLHFEADVSPTASLQWLIEDLRRDDPNFPAIKQLEYLILSGDVTHRGDDTGFDVARQFVEKLLDEADFGLSSNRCIFVPGNHDVQRRASCYRYSLSASVNDKQRVVKQGNIYLERDDSDYPNRLKRFSDAFYHKITSSEGYPLAPEQQGISYHFADTGIQFLALNTAWEIDQFFPGRSSVHPEALANAIKIANKQVSSAVKRGDRKRNQPQLRIAVFHHAVHGPWAMQNLDFISNLKTAGVKLCLHGDVHEMRQQWIDHWDEERSLHVIGTGTFGSKHDQITAGSARSYNLLEIASDLKSARIYVREQPKPNGAWQGWNEFPAPDGGRGKVPFFDISFT